MSDSSSEDDFMSDKYLQAAETTSRSSTATKTYAQRRQEAHKRHLEAQPKSRKVREEEARRQALETSLFDIHKAGVAGKEKDGGKNATSSTTGAGKAMGMMMKMGWKVGEGLGKKAVDDPLTSSRSHVASSHDTLADADTDDETPTLGIGFNKKRKLSLDPFTADATNAATPPPAQRKPRTEPIRISMWAGKLGVGAHQRSPSPEDMSFLLGQGQEKGQGNLSREAMRRLDSEADEFRKRRAGKQEDKRVEGMEWKARNLLKEFDEAAGIKVRPLPHVSRFQQRRSYTHLLYIVNYTPCLYLNAVSSPRVVQFHPLWIIPSAPETTIPRPLLRLIDPKTAEYLDLIDGGDPAVPEMVQGRPDVENVDEASRLREQMRRDALVELGADGENDNDDAERLAIRPGAAKGTPSGPVLGQEEGGGNGKDDEQVDWTSFVPGVRRVLAMSPSTHLTYLVSSLRADHLYCFWCAARYGSVQEMEGPGGCPGEEEDDH
ncbi:hypothetical protein QFC24_006063 [Naganishia onofrii]|uniref:Uncharacterized protein n=1 Tax=Naganishia onofrii TaxID=1851511 RepID=A0ACC2X639_9TREE|nr:hypothetical protein QFC24_006063 [Naganishia onofrii]